jgi:hypothetical protein
MSGMAAARTLVACIAAPEAAAWRLAEYDDWFSSGLIDGAEELSRLYSARGIKFHELDLNQGSGSPRSD